MAGTGMLQRGPIQPGAPMEDAPEDMPAQGDPGDEQPNVSPELQQQYDRFVVNGIQMIQASSGKIIERLKASQNPIEGLASATVMIVTRLEDSAESKGVKIDPEVLVNGGLEIMGTLAEVAEAANIHSFTEEEIENAGYAAMDQYGTARKQSGKLDEQAIGRDYQQMLEADKAGRLDEVLPGISEYARKVGGKGKPATAEAEAE